MTLLTASAVTTTPLLTALAARRFALLAPLPQFALPPTQSFLLTVLAQTPTAPTSAIVLDQPTMLIPSSTILTAPTAAAKMFRDPTVNSHFSASAVQALTSSQLPLLFAHLTALTSLSRSAHAQVMLATASTRTLTLLLRIFLPMFAVAPTTLPARRIAAAASMFSSTRTLRLPLASLLTLLLHALALT